VSRLGLMTVGYQGFGNLGDEAILTGIEQLLAEGSLEVQTVAGGPQPIAAFAAARRVGLHRLLPSLDALRALRRRRALLFAGGGLLHDHWATVIPSYLAWSILARLAGARIGWVAVGIGPLRHRWSRLLTGWTLRLATVVTVRDAGSAELARRVAPRVPVRIIPDPAIFNVPPAPADVRHGVGLVVRGPAPDDRERAGELAELLGRTAAALTERGREVIVLTVAGASDTPMAKAVAAAAARGGGSRPAVEELPADPAACLRRFAELEAMLSVRLHGVILGALAGTPVAGIAYDPKVAAWCDRLGTPVIGLDDVDVVALADTLAAAARSETRAGVAERLRELRSQRGEVRSLLEASLA
jgi:polysaccharide pyruvyl transferase CsaB